MSERPSSSNAGEMQTVVRVSVKDRLGPLPPQATSKRRDRSADRNHRRGRKSAKSAQGPEAGSQGGSKARIPVHERLGPLPPQAFKKNDQVQKRNRQQVWRRQGNFKAGQPVPGNEPEVKQRAPAVANVESEENVDSVEFVKPAVPFLPPVEPFNAELHRQVWTWVRPTTNSTPMEVDEST